jgi:hypothetical protein
LAPTKKTQLISKLEVFEIVYIYNQISVINILILTTFLVIIHPDIDSQIIMKELMKGSNKRGREDFENAISDDLETQNVPVLFLPWCRRFMRVRPPKFIKLAP